MGPRLLAMPGIAETVISALYDGTRMGRYDLHAYVVMPNHVHLLTTSRIPTSRWLGPLKGYTGHSINRLLGKHGPVWQEESFDHLVRNRDSFDRIKRYIGWNPVKARIVAAPEDFPFSSAAPKRGGRA